MSLERRRLVSAHMRESAQADVTMADNSACPAKAPGMSLGWAECVDVGISVTRKLITISFDRNSDPKRPGSKSFHLTNGAYRKDQLVLDVAGAGMAASTRRCLVLEHATLRVPAKMTR